MDPFWNRFGADIEAYTPDKNICSVQPLGTNPTFECTNILG